MEEKRPEVKAGIVISISVILLTGMIIAVGGYSHKFKPKRMLYAEFKDIQGVKENDPVFYAGRKIGRVENIKTITDYLRDESGKPVLKDGKPVIEEVRNRIYLQVTRRFEITDGTSATPMRSMMGTTWVDINPGRGKVIPPDGDTKLIGKEYIAIEKLGSLYGPKIGDTIEEIKETFKRVNDILGDKQREDLKQLFANAREAGAKADALFQDFGDMVSENRGKIGETIQNIYETSSTVRGLAEKRREDISQIIKNVNTASTKLNTILEKGDRFVQDANEFIAGANKLLDVNRDYVNDILINVRDSTANLEAMSEDIRKHPWLLLNRPADEELLIREAEHSAKELQLTCRELNELVSKLQALSGKKEYEKEVGEIIRTVRSVLQVMLEKQEQVEKLVEKLRKKK